MRLAHGICAIAALLCLLCLGAGAVSVIENKHDFVSNETITYTVTNMTDGVNYSQKTTVYQYLKPGNGSEFGNNNLTWPFAHKNDMFNMTNINTTYNTVVIGHWWPPAQGGSYEEATWNGYSTDIVTPDGSVIKNTWNESFSYEYDQTGTYVSHWKATPAPGATIVTSVFWINGTKISGPSDFTQNTSVWSMNPALVHVDWYENNTLTSQDWFTLDIDRAAIPTYVPGSGSGSESYTGSGSGSGAIPTGSGSGSGSDSGSGSGATTTTTTTTVAPSGTGDVTPSATETADAAEAVTTTPAPAGSPFAFAALGALGVAGLLLAGRVRR